MHLEIINPINTSRWNEWIVQHKDYSFFHTSYWAQVLRKSYAYEPMYVSLIANDALTASMPVMEVKSRFTGRRGVSLPFSDYCSPLYTEKGQFALLLQAAQDLGRERKWKYMKIRGGKDCIDDDRQSIQYFRHIVELGKDEQEIISGFSSNTKRNIKKAIREGVSVTKEHSLEAIREFYSLNCKTRQHHGLPPQPFSFFSALYTYVVARNHGFVMLARFRGNPIAGAVYLCFGKKALYKYGASVREEQQLRANNLIMWEAIRYLNGQGYSELCLGRTDMNNEGLRRFKKGWNASESAVNYYTYDFENRAFVSDAGKESGIHTVVFRKMPVVVLRTMGRMLYRHVG